MRTDENPPPAQGYGNQRLEAARLLTAEEKQVPNVAYPTLLLFVAAMSGFVTASFSYLAGMLSPAAVVVTNAIMIYVLFTPMHDAAHGSVAASKLVNAVVGRLCAFCFLGPFPAFRFVHLEHHKYTNDADRDPDFWSSRGPTVLLPLRWMTQMLHYYTLFFWRAKDLPRWDIIETFATLLTALAGIVWLCILGHGREIMLIWVLPAFVASGFLAYVFDYVPHRPHKVSSKESIYACTSKIGGIELDWVLLYQNYHNIHHLYPFLPFYSYKDVWFRHREDLIRLGTPEAPLVDTRTPWF